MENDLKVGDVIEYKFKKSLIDTTPIGVLLSKDNETFYTSIGSQEQKNLILYYMPWSSILFKDFFTLYEFKNKD